MEGSGSIDLLSASRIPVSRGPKVSGCFGGGEYNLLLGCLVCFGDFFSKQKFPPFCFLETYSPSQPQIERHCTEMNSLTLECPSKHLNGISLIPH